MAYSLEKKDIATQEELEQLLEALLVRVRQRRFLSGSISEELDTPIMTTDDASADFLDSWLHGEVIKLRIVTVPVGEPCENLLHLVFTKLVGS